MTQRHSASLHLTCHRCRRELDLTHGLGEAASTKASLDLKRRQASWGQINGLDNAKIDLCDGCAKAFDEWIYGDPSMWADVLIGTTVVALGIWYIWRRRLSQAL